jgi:hypothetical protein
MKCSTILLLASTALVAFVKAVPVVENDMAVKTAATMSAGCVMDIPAGGDKTKVHRIFSLSFTISCSSRYYI